MIIALSCCLIGGVKPGMGPRVTSLVQPSHHGRISSPTGDGVSGESQTQEFTDWNTMIADGDTLGESIYRYQGDPSERTQTIFYYRWQSIHRQDCTQLYKSSNTDGLFS